MTRLDEAKMVYASLDTLIIDIDVDTLIEQLKSEIYFVFENIKVHQALIPGV